MKRSANDATVEGGGAFVGHDGHVRPLEEVERAAIGFALRRYDGNLSEAARRLGIGRSTLYRRLTAMRGDDD